MQRFQFAASAALLLALTAVLGACASTGSSKPAATTGGPSLVTIQSHQHGQQSGIKFPALQHITDQAAFDALGLEGTSPVDFKKQDMIILAIGEQTTGGYKVRITKLLKTGNGVVVFANITRPGEGAVTQALTSPYCIVTVDKLGDVTLASEVSSM